MFQGPLSLGFRELRPVTGFFCHSLVQCVLWQVLVNGPCADSHKQVQLAGDLAPGAEGCTASPPGICLPPTAACLAGTPWPPRAQILEERPFPLPAPQS